MMTSYTCIEMGSWTKLAVPALLLLTVCVSYMALSNTKLDLAVNTYKADKPTPIQPRHKSLSDYDVKYRREEWRLAESLRLGALVQKRLNFLQNPKSCDVARKLQCFIHRTCGFGCVVNTIKNCLMLGYATRRTVIVGPNKSPTPITRLHPFSLTCTNSHGANKTVWSPTMGPYQVVEYRLFTGKPRYKPDIYPPAIPADLYTEIKRFHQFPFVWWSGQISKYVFRLTTSTVTSLTEAETLIGFTTPIAGVHIRRTDKLLHDAVYRGVEEYMVHVEAWYKELEAIKPGVQRRLFLATDDPTALSEIKSRYPNYTIYYNDTFAQQAGVETRTSDQGELGIIHDIHMLTKCDYVVCTFSSNICRLVYQLMQTTHGDASNNVKSLDRKFYHDFQREVPPQPVNMSTYRDI